MRAEHRRPFVAFFLVAALCALALGNTTGDDSVPDPSVGTPDRAIVPRAAPAPVGFELLGETAAQLLVKRIRSAAAVDVPAGPATPVVATTALAGVDAGAADSVAPEAARGRSGKTGSSATRAGDRGPSSQPAPQPTQLQTIERTPEPAQQPVHTTPSTTPQRSGGADRSGTSGPPAHAGSRDTSGRTSGRATGRATGQSRTHGKSHTKGNGKARAKSNGKAHGKAPRRGKGRR